MSIEIKAWKCEKCGKAWLLKEKADSCCQGERANTCRVCGIEIKPPLLICDACLTKERYEKAKKVKYSEYKIECLWDEEKQDYFRDKEDLFERYYDDAYEKGEQPIYPEWCFGCEEIPFKVDMDSALERASEEMYDEFDYDKDIVDLEELLEFMERWNKKQTAKAYVPDYKTVVLLNE